jgi:hypothetical protein
VPIPFNSMTHRRMRRREAQAAVCLWRHARARVRARRGGSLTQLRKLKWHEDLALRDVDHGVTGRAPTRLRQRVGVA